MAAPGGDPVLTRPHPGVTTRQGLAMGHRHSMPFGAEMGDGRVRFRLWAPAATRVDLLLIGDRPRSVPMRGLGDGWFEAQEASAEPGSPYLFRIDGDAEVPDPASRHQPADVHGPSAVVDPDAYAWGDGDWRGRPWHEAVFYELHVGTFTPKGTFDGVRERLDHLVALGATAVELMPVADFSGARNWGYDGVLPFAPDSSYGGPDDLKRLVDAAHRRGLMMFLDVVYNHLGPDGNYLHLYAPQFFTDRFDTPWGAAIDFSHRTVRDFFIDNALYWLAEYRFDGLRLDAVHAIDDDTSPDILEEIADAVHRRFAGDRHVHLILENDDNAARYLERGQDGRPRHYVAQWNDDIHHALHVLATGETAGHYGDYAERPVDHLRRCLAEGFAYQGEQSTYRGGRPRGEPSAHLPPTAFVSFLQNHDQVGNRASGERLSALSEPRKLTVLLAMMLLAPGPPLLFMGEEWAATEPFPFFCDFRGQLARNVRDGRCREISRFFGFRDAVIHGKMPDPNAEDTFTRAVLDWTAPRTARHGAWLRLYRALLSLRHREIVPRLKDAPARGRTARRFGEHGLSAAWRLGDGARLLLLANLGAAAIEPIPAAPRGRLLYTTDEAMTEALQRGVLLPWCAAWYLE